METLWRSTITRAQLQRSINSLRRLDELPEIPRENLVRLEDDPTRQFSSVRERDIASNLAFLSAMPGSGGGVIIYLRQEGRGIGLGEKLKAYNLQDLGSDTVEANLLLRHPAHARSYGLATAMLAGLGVKDIRLLTDNPDKVRAVEGPNREIIVKERVAMIPLAWRGKSGGIRSQEVGGYLKTKVCTRKS
jgi:GTP cyclohydrolase II